MKIVRPFHAIAFSINFLLLGELSAPRSAFAQQAVCGSNGVIFYLNGILTQQDDARDAAHLLEVLVKPRLTSNEKMNTQFASIYNRSAGGISGFTEDLLESIYQSAGLTASRFIKAIEGLIPIEGISDELDELSKALVEDFTIDQQTLDDVLSMSRSSFAQGQKVTIVAHSQGNLYANSAFTILSSIERQHWDTVNVAVPDSEVDGSPGGAYTTLVEDGVIRLVAEARAQAGLPAALPPNVQDGYLNPFARTLNHGFVAAYLSGHPSGSQILDGTVQAYRAITSPQQQVGQGPFTTTLTWQAVGDVDLHIYEPNGDHVYYANRQGQAGYLDQDNTYGFGPEHYYTSCSNVIPGNYVVGVNYYRGDVPQVATIAVQAGGTTRTFVQNLPTAHNGPSGDQSPIPVADVQIVKDQNGSVTAIISGP